MYRQVCVIKTVAYSLRTDRHTLHGQTKKKKTEGPKLLSNYIFHFKTVMIGGPMMIFRNVGYLKSIVKLKYSERKSNISLHCKICCKESWHCVLSIFWLAEIVLSSCSFYNPVIFLLIFIPNIKPSLYSAKAWLSSG